MLFRLSAIPNVQLFVNAPLARYTRFEIGGPARMLANVSTVDALAETLQLAKDSGTQRAIIGGGTNLIVDDEGFPGVVVRYVPKNIEIEGTQVRVEAGAVLHDKLFFSYRTSIFKSFKDWIVLDAVLKLKKADPAALRATADGILKIRNEKYPPTMKCAGSIFKNLLLADLPSGVAVPEKIVREGKVPSAWFLEAAGAKGLAIGGLKVADYHANLIYNEGGGTARDLWHLIETLKLGVWEKFGVKLEEEVQSIRKH